MADEELSFRASLVDNTTAALKSIKDRLVSLGGAKEHLVPLSGAFSGLSKEIKTVAIPALESIGITSGGVVASLMGMGAALKVFSSGTVYLTYFSRDVGLSTRAVEDFTRVAERMQVSHTDARQTIADLTNSLYDLEKKADSPVYLQLALHGAQPLADKLRSLVTSGKMEEAVKAVQEHMDRLTTPLQRREFSKILTGGTTLTRMGLKATAEVLRTLKPITDADAVAAKLFSDNLADLDDSLTNVKRTLGNALLPSFIELSKQLDSFTSGEGFLQTIRDMGTWLEGVDWKPFVAGVKEAGEDVVWLVSKIRDFDAWIHENQSPDDMAGIPGTGAASRSGKYFRQLSIDVAHGRLGGANGIRGQGGGRPADWQNPKQGDRSDTFGDRWGDFSSAVKKDQRRATEDLTRTTDETAKKMRLMIPEGAGLPSMSGSGAGGGIGGTGGTGGSGGTGGLGGSGTGGIIGRRARRGSMPAGATPEGRAGEGGPVTPGEIPLTGGAAGRGGVSLTGMDPELRARLNALYSGAPDDVKRNLSLGSGYRAPDDPSIQAQWAEHQRKVAAGIPVRPMADPRHSQHGRGQAGDLATNDDPATIEYLKTQARKYGLTFPVAGERPGEGGMPHAQKDPSYSGQPFFKPKPVTRVDAALVNETGLGGFHGDAVVDVNFGGKVDHSKEGVSLTGKLFKDVKMKTTPQMPMAGVGDPATGWEASP
jgi:hypothetical protein